MALNSSPSLFRILTSASGLHLWAEVMRHSPIALKLESTWRALMRWCEPSGAYDNGHKTDDGDQPNPNGHDRYLEGALLFSRARWLVLWHGLEMESAVHHQLHQRRQPSPIWRRVRLVSGIL